MLSYQHAYHAGNCADVHKHLALVMLIRRLQQKDTPLCYVDTHAGRGIYDLESEEARKTGEAANGIRRLTTATADAAPEPVLDYLRLIAGFNRNGGCRHYPGSSALARALLREQDCAVLLEMHPQEVPALKRLMANDARVSVHARDCHEGLPALLPPSIRRGLVLIDPSFEVKTEYFDVAALLAKALARWSTPVYVLWYPLLRAARHRALLSRVAALQRPQTLVSELRFSSAADEMQGSGLAIINTPWRFDTEVEAAMRHVTANLGSAGDARYEQRWLTASST